MGALPDTEAHHPVVGRLAPSPTGPLHPGHARSFCAAWWSARSAGGSVVLRIEDLDFGRCSPEFADLARRDLEWLGLEWDAELVQSEDLAPYEEAVQRLLDAGHAYPCVCSRRDIRAALSAPHRSGEELHYAGTCRDRFESVEAAERESGLTAGVRLRVPADVLSIDDRIAGHFEATPAEECGDFLLMRRDGAVAYQLAVVVDDGRQGVTEVVRGDDLLPSAVRQRLLHDRLGLAFPTQAHLPLVVDPSGRRLAKRDGDPSLADLREAGVAASTVLRWIAASCGLPTEGRASAADWSADFRLSAIPRDPAEFTPEAFGLPSAGGEA